MTIHSVSNVETTKEFAGLRYSSLDIKFYRAPVRIVIFTDKEKSHEQNTEYTARHRICCASGIVRQRMIRAHRRRQCKRRTRQPTTRAWPASMARSGALLRNRLRTGPRNRSTPARNPMSCSSCSTIPASRSSALLVG